jgi:16S rRNA A1518/A1519 N6-dimethyltransferase RsmA/KsgA/DIM1 with predicted DNA glycosylase/AP lyase activity
LDRRTDADGQIIGGKGSARYERTFSLVRAGFAHRRKMLRRSLEGLVAPDAFAGAGIEPTARAEELDLTQWERLSAWAPPGPVQPPAGS